MARDRDHAARQARRHVHPMWRRSAGPSGRPPWSALPPSSRGPARGKARHSPAGNARALMALDTNVLVHALDGAAGEASPARGGAGDALSSVGDVPPARFAEFASVAIRKLQLDPTTERLRVLDLTIAAHIEPYDQGMCTPPSISSSATRSRSGMPWCFRSAIVPASSSLPRGHAGRASATAHHRARPLPRRQPTRLPSALKQLLSGPRTRSAKTRHMSRIVLAAEPHACNPCCGWPAHVPNRVGGPNRMLQAASAIRRRMSKSCWWPKPHVCKSCWRPAGTCPGSRW